MTLLQHAGLAPPAFEYRAPDWRLAVPPGPFARLEYQFALHQPDGRTEVVCDPVNPRRVASSAGEKSVLELPGYAPPAWLHSARRPGRWRRFGAGQVWSPDEPTDRMLVAHDGRDYRRYGALTRYSASRLVAAHHLVLLDADDRADWYGANPVYATRLCTELIPRLRRALRVRHVFGLGASLGGLAMLYAQVRHPGSFTGLYLQSGSFFRPRYDRHESGFRRYRPIIRFTGRLARGLDRGRPVRTVLTCGLAEENLHNNRDMAWSLRRLGYPVRLVEGPDAHNFTAWRDALHPGLADLLAPLGR